MLVSGLVMDKIILASINYVSLKNVIYKLSNLAFMNGTYSIYYFVQNLFMLNNMHTMK